ncbi:Coenzyme F420 hydrogenase/dehydrogenase, beta subunit C-terminal domain [Candidatus Bathyarchaeota archaeon]|nr:Coenzyme F420 hydrogenase/dehydrogenase, beta subunit C-terminal domain [Candidatus Bathyarchaeota archaeon]
MSSIINQVKNLNLCTGCGTCAGVCLNNAIEMKKSESEGLYLPHILQEKCTQCGICSKVCPGYEVDFNGLNEKIFGKRPEDNSLGNYLSTYVGESCDINVRFNSSSGGLASHILIYALEKQIIDGAIVTRMNREKPLETETFIARTSGEILEASKSKYCPVTSNKVLKHILREDGRFAIIGLPCHIHGIRKAENIYKPLQNKIVLHIGLMCSHEVNFRGTEFLIGKMHINKKDVKQIAYRGNGWPGGMSVTLRDNSLVKIPLFGSWHSYWPVFSSFFFTPIRCFMCPDQTAELADISLGDAWLPELMNDKTGKSIIVSRTEKAEQILSQMKNENLINIRRIPPEKVRQSQRINMIFKKDDFSSRLSLLASRGLSIPRFNNIKDTRITVRSILRFIYAYTNMKSSTNPMIVSILKGVPLPIFRCYQGLYKFLSRI